MYSPAAHPKILYRNSRLLRMVFLQLHRQQRADLFCDVVLQAEGEAVPAHCCILSACSPFFTERLEREMPPKGHKVVLEIRGLKIGTLRKLVDFLYTSEMEVSREEAQDILAAARQLQVSELESLQLEGGKLVKKSLGPRLNRGCLQISSPEAGLIESSTAGNRNSSLTPLVVTGKQHTAVKLSCTRMVDNENRSEQNEIKKQKPAVALSHDDTPTASKGPVATTEPLRTKVKKRPSSAVKSILGNTESGALHIEEAGTVQKEPAVSLKASKKIKLRRSKLSSPSPAVPGATKNHCAMMSSELSRSSRRLWRQKSKEEADNARDSINLPSFWSPLLPKHNKGRRRNLSEPALSTDLPPEAGQISRVKLRKVINGSCWEVVPESPPATQLARAANSACTLKNGVSQPQLKCPQSVVDVQHSADSAKQLLAEQVPACCSEGSLVKKTESSKVVSEEGENVVNSSYDLSMFMTDHMAEGEQYDSLASAGELEHLLDFLLADDDDDAIGESQVPAVPEGTPMACLAQGGNKSPGGRTGAEEKDRHPTEMSGSPQVVESEKRLQREQEAPVLEIHKETRGSSDGRPLLDPVLGSPLLMTNESTSDCLTLCRSASLNDSTEPKHQLSVQENGAGQLTEPLPVTMTCDEEQGLLSYEVGILGTETTPYSQAMLSHVQCSVDYKLPSGLTSFEEEELDVGGVEELFISSNCVRPDPSPEIEVDVLS